MTDTGWEKVEMTPDLHEALTGLKDTLDGGTMNDDGTTEPWEDNALARQIISERNRKAIAALDAYSLDPDAANVVGSEMSIGGRCQTVVAHLARFDLDYYFKDPDTHMTETTDKNKAASSSSRTTSIAALDDGGWIAASRLVRLLEPGEFIASQRPDTRAPVLRLAALLLGLCIVTGAAAFVAATGGGTSTSSVGWALAVFATLAAVFGLGVMAGRE